MLNERILVRFAHKEYVASLIGLYKNNGTISCVSKQGDLEFILISMHSSFPAHAFK